MGGWGGAFMQGFNEAQQRRRQSRRDLLEEEMLRGQMALQQSADARAEALARERTANAATLRGRMEYLDRMKVLGRDTGHFQGLLGKYPGAGAGPDVSKAFELDDRIARDPASADVRPPLVDPSTGAMAGPFREDSVPTPREQRSTHVDFANELFGREQGRLQKALEAYRLRLAGAQKGAGQPKTTALDVQLRAVEAKEKMADALENGVIFDDKGMLRGIMTPEQIPAARQQAARLRQEAAERRAQLGDLYRQAGAVAPSAYAPPSAAGPDAAPRETPEAAAARLQAGGLSADEIAAQLETMFTPQELEAFGAQE